MNNISGNKRIDFLFDNFNYDEIQEICKNGTGVLNTYAGSFIILNAWMRKCYKKQNQVSANKIQDYMALYAVEASGWDRKR